MLFCWLSRGLSRALTRLLVSARTALLRRGKPVACYKPIVLGLKLLVNTAKKCCCIAKPSLRAGSVAPGPKPRALIWMDELALSVEISLR